MLPGHLAELFDRHGMNFQLDLAQNYGPVVKIYGPLGVNRSLRCHDYCWHGSQRKMLYVYEPKALHHILLKDDAIYEEGESFIW